MMARVPVRAITALRTHVERFFDAHRLASGQGFSELNLETFDLAEMLLAGLRYVREEYPWIGHKGIVIEPPEDEPWQLALELAKALPDDDDVPLTVDGCIEALQKVHGFEVVNKPCGHKIAPPRAYLYRYYRTLEALRDISYNIHGIVAEEDWLNSEARRTQAFNEALTPNSETQAFVEIDADTASKLAAFLMAGPAHPGVHHTYRAAAEAFAEIFGKQTRVFALEGLNDDTLENPFAHGHSWSQYGDNGSGTWGDILVVIATDGLRVAHVDALWDVASEG